MAFVCYITDAERQHGWAVAVGTEICTAISTAAFRVHLFISEPAGTFLTVQSTSEDSVQ